MGKHPPKAEYLCQNDSIKKKETSKLFALQSKEKSVQTQFHLSQICFCIQTLFFFD